MTAFWDLATAKCDAGNREWTRMDAKKNRTAEYMARRSGNQNVLQKPTKATKATKLKCLKKKQNFSGMAVLKEIEPRMTRITRISA